VDVVLSTVMSVRQKLAFEFPKVFGDFQGNSAKNRSAKSPTPRVHEARVVRLIIKTHKDKPTSQIVEILAESGFPRSHAIVQRRLRELQNKPE
jgi:hypothetical protein